MKYITIRYITWPRDIVRTYTGKHTVRPTVVVFHMTDKTDVIIPISNVIDVTIMNTEDAQ
jgi:hypothetical protein